ncbi:MAG: hypothetical protein FWD71_08270 [Oscillospiraceae bacterium]|nr:hypothetical protein [Oscillospiraceae bacterium]
MQRHSKTAREITELEKKTHIGYYLLKKSKSKQSYFIIITAMVLLFCGVAYKFAGFMFLLLILPLWEFAKQMTDFIFARISESTPLPKIEITNVPDDKKTLVCVTTLLFGEGKDDLLFDRLETFYQCNRDKNINFSILGDLKDSGEKENVNDDKIIEYAKKRISGLNNKYNNSFSLFIRDRVYSKSEKRYMGWERKRGALLELVRFIKGRQTTLSTVCGNINFIKDAKYIVTLDADTNLGIDGVKDMLSAMLHPNAKPVFDEDKKIVVDGYGIMQPRMGTELSASAKTTFTRMLSGSGGVDIYSSAAFDLYQEIYGEGNFCGKGIFDVDMFYKTLDNAYPEETVLSHDLLEGTRLRCALITDLELTDGLPKNPVSYFDRLHRWIRGDMQALRFIGAKTKNAAGETVKNPINALSKYKIFDNVRRAALPVFAVIAMIISVIIPYLIQYSQYPYRNWRENNQPAVLIFSVLYIIFPMIAGIISIFIISSFQNISKRFSSKVMTSIWQSICGALFDLSALSYRAFLSLDAILRSIFRMFITKRRMLSWVTASESEKNLKGFALYVKKMFLSSVLGLAFILFSPYGIYKILGAMWLVFPVVAYVTGKENDDGSESKISAIQENKLRNYISDMWKFYASTVNKHENYLPPDNIQFFPIESTAHRTSPTNIGLYMLSVLCARDFGLIDTKTMCAKLDSTFSTVEKMAKWNGHLYNWYDTKNLNVIGSRFVSTVDSGNFAACLTALKEGIKEYNSGEYYISIQNVITRAEKILEGMNFYALYNSSRDLFYIGYDEETGSFGDNCYDLYMSEAKITSYFAIARREVSKKHWQKLGRTLIKENGYMGLASWTGTAFEYFMPNLLLPLHKSSLTYEAHRFALREQIKRRAKYAGTEVWGISESGFYAFDFDMNYQYQAFGVQKLGLKRGLNKDLVISPYSSFLALSIAPSAAIGNLSRLEKIGMYGRYGFYEACDFTHSRVGNGMNVVKSYMAHHVGMSIIAAANACCDNIFQKRFMSDIMQKSAAEILDEKIPVDAIIFEDINSREVPEKINRSYGLIEKNTGKINLENPVCRIISNSKSKIIASSSGDILLLDGAHTINYADFDRYTNTKQLSVLFKYKDEVFSQSKIPLNRKNAEYSYEFTDALAHYSVKEIIDSEHITGDATYSLASDMSCYIVTAAIHITDMHVKNSNNSNNISIRNKNEGILKKLNVSSDIEILLYFEPILAKFADFNAHPAFSSLSIEAEYDEKNKILFYKRRPRLESESEKWLAISVSDTGILDGNQGLTDNQNKTNKTDPLDFMFESRRDDIFPHCYDESDIKNLFYRTFSNTYGACINPVCAVKVKPKIYYKNHKHICEASFFIAFAGKREEAVNILRNAKLLNRDKENQKISENNQNRFLVSGMTSKEKNLLDIILSCMYCKTINNKPIKDDIAGLSSSIKMLWKEGISGDLPIVLLIIKDMGGVGDSPNNIDSINKMDIFEEYLRVYKYLTLSGQKFDLVVIYSETEKYNRPCRNKLADIVKKNGGEHFLKRKGGIFLLDKSELEPKLVGLLKAFASYKYEINGDISNINSLADIHRTHNIIDEIPEIKIKSENTGNTEEQFENFVFDKPFYKIHGGYFAKSEAFYIDCNGKKAPWSHIISNRQFGTLITHKSLGFTWYSNARERRLTAWENDPVSDMKSERLILNIDGEKYDLCAISSYLKIFPNGAEYYGRINNIEYKISVTVDEKLFVKLIDAGFYQVNNILNNSDKTDSEIRNIEVSYLIKPVMGVSESKLNFIDINDVRTDTISFINVCNADFYGYSGFIRAIGGKIKSHDLMEFLTDSKINTNEFDYIAVSKILALNADNTDNQENRAVFVLGCYKSVKYFDYMYKKLSDFNFIKSMAEKSGASIRKYMPEIKLSTSNPALDVIFNTFVPYQNIAGRIFGRTGFYQSSGAFGYRDQLQDVAALVYSAPELVRAHIYRSAAHQFLEGDVQHWWHNIKSIDADDTKSHRGVRTRCSDDYLWLPYITSFYINKTDDYNILDTKIEYITDALLSEDEKERYSEPIKSNIKESVYEHCKKSIEYGLKFGGHGLPLIGTCDWNDGMSLVGAEGKGESVWLAWFLILVLQDFIPICESKNDFEISKRYKLECEKLKNAIEQHCFEDGRYLRGFYDNGDKLGSKESDECKIDILPQTFAAITANTDNTDDRFKVNSQIVMNTAYNNLFDRKYKILKLFAPPFVDGNQNPGYIKGYVAGIRENGGQYTHAAVWGALGFLSLGDLGEPDGYKKGWEIIQALNPAVRCSDKELAEIYRIEPYVLSGDVYSNISHTGRGGWSWYTGSAAWYYRVILENLLGFKLCGDKFYINPISSKYIDELNNFSLKIKIRDGIYNINVYKQSGQAHDFKISLDSNETRNPVFITDGEHKIDIFV